MSHGTEDEDQIAGGQPGWCTVGAGHAHAHGRCVYSIGVFGWSATAYTIRVTSRINGHAATVLLQEAVPVRSEVAYQQMKYFKYMIADTSKGIAIAAVTA